MHLEVADRLARLLDDPRLDVGTREPLLHLGARERLVVPVARDLGIRVPGDEAVDVSRRRPAAASSVVRVRERPLDRHRLGCAGAR